MRFCLIAEVFDPFFLFLDEEMAKFCSKTYGVELVSEFHTKNLNDLMDERKTFTRQQYVKFFQEGEVWDFLDQILKALMKLRNKGIFFDDIQPMNILVCPNTENNGRGSSEFLLKLLNPKYFLNEE